MKGAALGIGGLGRLGAPGAVGINRVMKLSAANTGIVTTAINDTAIGVALNAATGAGELVAIQTHGVAKCVAKEAISVGDQVMCYASEAGKIGVAAGATAIAIGVAMEAATADGDTIAVQLSLPGTDRPAVA